MFLEALFLVTLIKDIDTINKKKLLYLVPKEKRDFTGDIASQRLE